MSCCYADARSPEELWENVLAQRRSFRRIPAQRLRLEDYYCEDRSQPDATYSKQAAVIRDFEFDRVKFKVSGYTFRSTDMAHWLALDTAARAFADANLFFEDIPKKNTGVFLGNTLTGEFSRANNLRLRYPFVRRIVESVLEKESTCRERLPEILENLEAAFKEPFPPVNEESLAGGLSNTIAGRICNHFNLQGGGYTVDGACSSSLLAVSNACSALVSGEVDLALAGGVDLSLDPFELVGFAKTGALAADMMRVYDARSDGFLPGEGCGFVLLMREPDAIRLKRKIYARINGWGISSDGSGGLTRPEIGGQLLALQRAYLRAGIGIDTVCYFEGHGTGTAVGDTTELKALSKAREEAGAETQAVVGSIKALIGHTKAAAGIAGLIKAIQVLQNEVLPATAGCEIPHAELLRPGSTLKILRRIESWPDNYPLRAGVSSMGFGGINAHIVLEKERAAPLRHSLSSREKSLDSSPQDSELFLFSAESREQLIDRLKNILNFSAQLSLAETGDLAAYLARNLSQKKFRAAIVAATPEQFFGKLSLLLENIRETGYIDTRNGVFYGEPETAPRIGFLFTGQGSPLNLSGGLWRRRFEAVDEIYREADLETGSAKTGIAQPAIVTASLAAIKILRSFGITGEVGIGHSLGEITALHWGGAFDEDALFRIVKMRGRAMADKCRADGAMLSISASRKEIEPFLNGDNIVIAGLNAPDQIVVSGDAAAVTSLQKKLHDTDIASVRLDVSQAFHSSFVAPSVPLIKQHLEAEEFSLLGKNIFSTVTGERLTSEIDLKDLLCRQITAPVRFAEAVEKAGEEKPDLWIEAGTGQHLCALVRKMTGTPAIAVEAGSESLKGLWLAVGASFVLGQEIDQQFLHRGRFNRDFDLDWKPEFFANPCEEAPLPAADRPPREVPVKLEKAADIAAVNGNKKSGLSPAEFIVKLVSECAELPVSAIKPESRMLSDLHLNSITVGQIVAVAAKEFGSQRPLNLTDFANASILDIAEALEKLKEQNLNGHNRKDIWPAGIDMWVRPFAVELVEKPRPLRELVKGKGNWRIFTPEGYPRAEEIAQGFAETEGSGVVVCLPSEPNESHVTLLLKGAKEALNVRGKFVLIEHGRSSAAFAKSFALENPQLKVCVINVPDESESTVNVILNEVSAAAGNLTEAYFNAEGKRFEPLVKNVKKTSHSIGFELSKADVLLVTGGGKGITAECVLALAKETGVRLALIGTAKPETDPELANNLARFEAHNIDFSYHRIDITDREALRSEVRKIVEKHGDVTAILHAAARNKPETVANLSEAAFLRTLAVKFTGAQNLLEAVDTSKLKRFITFSSVIARTGMAGESDYGLANEWLTSLTRDFQAKYPHCRSLAIEWSVWAGVGMGTKIADLDLLERQGIVPIPVEKGIRVFLELLTRKDLPPSVIVSSRFPDTPACRRERPELPLLRFLEEPRVYYPGIELICDVEISTATDLYLDDHRVQGERLLPAVMGMEAMAQAATALLGEKRKPSFKDLEFFRPVVIKNDEPHKIRIAALARENGSVEIALRSAETDFLTDHFRAVCRFDEVHPPQSFELNGYADSRVELEPALDLYGKILFHKGRFQCLRGYKYLKAKECVAQLGPQPETGWFNKYLPGEFLLGDPGMRDAAIHSIQACIPHVTLLPVGVGHISIREVNNNEPCLVHAREISQIEDIFTYDLEILNLSGEVLETWQGLRLKAVNGLAFQGEWSLSLLAVYLERKLGELVKTSDVSVALMRDPNLERRELSSRAMQAALGENITILRRNDGKPEAANGKCVSASHLEDLTLAAAGRSPVGCDIEKVVPRDPDVWREMLGEDGYKLAQKISEEVPEELDSSATRVWSAKECLKKSGLNFNSSLTLSSLMKDKWITMFCDLSHIATYATQVQNVTDTIICAILIKEGA
jgi:enediyne polyketide synthase